MLIAKAEIFLTEIPYKNPYQTATNITPKGRHIVLKLTTDTGLVGWGESGIISRRYPAQGDTPETMLAALESYLCPAIIGKDPWETLKKTSRFWQNTRIPPAEFPHEADDLR